MHCARQTHFAVRASQYEDSDYSSLWLCGIHHDFEKHFQDYHLHDSEFCKCLYTQEDMSDDKCLCARRKILSACFTDVTSTTTCPKFFLHNSRSEPIRAYQGENRAH